MTHLDGGIPLVVANALQSSLYPIKHRVQSAWNGHIPFMFALMRILRPSVYVELGVHNGASFFAACQAVVQEGLKTRCVAVDHWEGDPHAGIFDGAVFIAFDKILSSSYSGFASYIRKDFDDAAKDFSDATIDLLHIDGFHTYEAVKNDFETWLPKLSSRGVILFHDVNEYRGSFGVWRFWQEIEATHPGRTRFLGNDHGLGILVTGDDLSDDAQKFFSWVESSENWIFVQQHLSAISELQKNVISLLSGAEKSVQESVKLRQALEKEALTVRSTIDDLETRQQQHLNTINDLETRQQQHLNTINDLETRQQQHLNTINDLETRQQQHLNTINDLETRQQQHLNTINDLELEIELLGKVLRRRIVRLWLALVHRADRLAGKHKTGSSAKIEKTRFGSTGTPPATRGLHKKVPQSAEAARSEARAPERSRQIAPRAEGILVVHVSANESERQNSLDSVRRQKGVQLEVVEISDKKNKEAHVLTSDAFHRAPSKFVRVKIDADMVILDDSLLQDVLDFFNSARDYHFLHVAIRDCFSGQWMQGINFFSPRRSEIRLGQHPLRTDHVEMAFDERYFCFEWADRVLHAPNPHFEQALHFGAHRAAKVLESAGSDWPNIYYLTATLNRAEQIGSTPSQLAVRGAQAVLASNGIGPEHLDYSSSGWRSFVEKIGGEGKGTDIAKGLAPLLPKSASGTLPSQTVTPNTRLSWAILLPHLLHFGGIQRFLYLARELIRIGDDVEILVVDLGKLDESLALSFPDVLDRAVEFTEQSRSTKVRHFVVAGDSSTDLLLRMRRVRGERYISFVIATGDLMPAYIEAQIQSPADLVISVSTVAQDAFPLPSLLIPGGVDDELFRGDDTLSPTTGPLRLVAHWGRGKAKKGGDRTIELAEAIRAERPDFELYLVNAGPITERVLPDFVRQRTNQTRSGLANLLSESHGLIAFESDSGWSNPQAEMAASGGMILGNGHGAEDFIRSYPMAFLSQPDETISEYVSRLRPQLGRSFQAAIVNKRPESGSGMALFSWNHWAAQVREACTELLKFPLNEVSQKRTQSLTSRGIVSEPKRRAHD